LLGGRSTFRKIGGGPRAGGPGQIRGGGKKPPPSPDQGKNWEARPPNVPPSAPLSGGAVRSPGGEWPRGAEYSGRGPPGRSAGGPSQAPNHKKKTTATCPCGLGDQGDRIWGRTRTVEMGGIGNRVLAIARGRSGGGGPGDNGIRVGKTGDGSGGPCRMIGLCFGKHFKGTKGQTRAAGGGGRSETRGVDVAIGPPGPVRDRSQGGVNGSGKKKGWGKRAEPGRETACRAHEKWGGTARAWGGGVCRRRKGRPVGRPKQDTIGEDRRGEIPAEVAQAGAGVRPPPGQGK